MRELSLFTGAGGGLLGSRILGWTTVCGVEIDPYCRGVLAARQSEGFLDPFPVYDDVRNFDGRPWAGLVDVVTGGFPCQDISSAGSGKGLSGARSGLWFEMERIIDESKPRWVLIENSPLLRTRGLERVLGGLAGMGLDAAWGVLGGHHTGAPHQRKRMWVVAHTHHRWERMGTQHAKVAGASAPTGCVIETKQSATAYPYGDPLHVERRGSTGEGRQGALVSGRVDWPTVDSLPGMDDGMADRMGDKIRATGNGQIPRVVALAWNTLAPRLCTDCLGRSV